MEGTAVTQQSPVPPRQANQVQAMGEEDTAKEVLPWELVTKDVVEKTEVSTTHNAHHQ